MLNQKHKKKVTQNKLNVVSKFSILTLDARKQAGKGFRYSNHIQCFLTKSEAKLTKNDDIYLCSGGPRTANGLGKGMGGRHHIRALHQK